MIERAGKVAELAFKGARLGDPAISVEFHTGHTTDDEPNWDYFRKEWEDYLPDIIPIGLTLTVRRWKNRSGGAPIALRQLLLQPGYEKSALRARRRPPV